MAITTVQLLMEDGFICKTSFRARTIYLSIITGKEYKKMLTIKLIYKNLTNSLIRKVAKVDDQMNVIH